MRLVSARSDVLSAFSACQYLEGSTDEDLRHHLFTSLVLSYCRPFTENSGIGSLKCEYPNFPDFPDPELNLRHSRMMDIRNKILGHSSVEGIHVFLLAPGAVAESTQKVAAEFMYETGKLFFDRPEYVPWFRDLIVALDTRLHADALKLCKEIGSRYLKRGERLKLDTGHPTFKWSK
jgi:hypothetical protein